MRGVRRHARISQTNQTRNGITSACGVPIAATPIGVLRLGASKINIVHVPKNKLGQLRCKPVPCRSTAVNFAFTAFAIERLNLLQHKPNRRIVPISLRAITWGLPRVQNQFHTVASRLVGLGHSLLPPNKRMQPTHQPVIKFACAKAPPVWRATVAWR